MTRTALSIIAITLCLAPALPGRAARSMRIEMHMFLCSPSVTMDYTLEEKFNQVWADSQADWLELRGKVQLFDQGRFQSGTDALTLSADGCLWNGTALPAQNNPISQWPNSALRLLYSPTVQLQEDEKSSITLNAEQWVDYFEKQTSELFALKHTPIQTGLDIQFDPEYKKSGWTLDDMKITLRSVGQREMIEGVQFPVGKPIPSVQELELDLKVQPQKWYGILIRMPNSHETLLLCLKLIDTP
ncbi:MAG: hypothetical protein RBU29_12500 [bacterium]|jgi:hypothetical protein|nr:hypothetical protein [bacterium]